VRWVLNIKNKLSQTEQLGRVSKFRNEERRYIQDIIATII